MATTATPCIEQQTAFSPPLFLAFALGVNKGQRGFPTGAAPRPRERQVPAGDGHTVRAEIRRAKSRFGWPEDPRGLRCYEAGRAGFWRHRCLGTPGVEPCGVDSARIAGKRRHRAPPMCVPCGVGLTRSAHYWLSNFGMAHAVRRCNL